MVATLAREERLLVDGVLPPGLAGCYLQAEPHPAAASPGGHRAAAGPHMFSGVRLDGGTASWLRDKMAVRRADVLQPVPALAPSVWLAGRSADGPAPVSLARPVREAGASTWHTIATSPGLDYAEHLIAGPDGAILHAEPFALEGAPLMQAVALTRRYVVVLDLPVRYHLAAALVGARFPYAWSAGRPARVGLLSRTGGQAGPRWFAIDQCFVFETVNAYDDGDQVVLDAVRHSQAFPADGEAPQACRWTFDLAGGAVRTRRLFEVRDTAIVDERVSGRRHRFAFGSTGTALVRHDLATAATEAAALGTRLAGRPVFAPDPEQDAEGAGWIVVPATVPGRDGGELMVFDARDLAAGARAVVRLPVGLPAARRATWLGRHGNHGNAGCGHPCQPG